MTLKKIPDAELEIMDVILDNEKPISSKQIIKVMKEKRGWKSTTTLTLISRLFHKEFIRKRISYYSPIVTKKVI